MTGEFKAEYFFDAVGRRRKLSAGAIISLQREFREGAKTADLAETYGISVSLVRTITYNTPRNSDATRIDEARRALQEAYSDLVLPLT